MGGRTAAPEGKTYKLKEQAMGNLEIDLDKLRDRPPGSLSEEEVRAVAEALAEGEPSSPASLLTLLGRSGSREHEHVVARYLSRTDEPWIVRTALHVLVGYWGLGRPYRDFLLRGIEGFSWDDDSDVRLVAIHDAGEWLRSERDDVLSVALRRVAESADDPLADLAALAVTRANGAPWREALDSMPGQDDEGGETVANARALLKRRAQDSRPERGD